MTFKTTKDIKYYFFLSYSFFYVMSMVYGLPQILYFAFLAGYIGIGLVEYILKRRNRTIVYFKKELYSVLLMYFALMLISLFFQIKNFSFSTYVVKDIVYMVLPLIIGFLWVNTVSYEELDLYRNTLVIRYIIHFVLQNYSKISFAAIRSISWSNSKSSVFESSYAHDFLLLEIWCLFCGKRKTALICTILCMLSFKRLSFILSSVTFIVYCVFDCIRRKKHITDKKCQGFYKVIAGFWGIVFVVSAFFMEWLAVRGGAEKLSVLLNFDVAKFMTGRIEIIQEVYSGMDFFNGLGSINEYILHTRYALLGSMHCDVLRIYWETTIIGVVLFAYAMCKSFCKSWASLIALCYVLFLNISSHSLHALTMWIIFYMMNSYVSFCETNLQEVNSFHEKGFIN